MTRVSSELIKRYRKALLIGVMLLLCAAPALTRRITVAQTDQVFDIVLANGRTIDPESSLDTIRHIGIRGGRIEAISASPLRGQTVIDARGLVVAPGFIDLHSHGQNDENYRFKARDGVTTALELEVGVSPVATWYTARAGKARVNFGATVGHIPARMAVTHDSGTFLPRDKAITSQLTQAELKEMNDLIRRGLDDGALGVGFGIAYVPAARREEVLDVFQLAADRQVPCFVHVRSHGAVEPGSAIESVQEVIADTAATGASLHIVHITSTGLGQTAICLRMIEGARPPWSGHHH
jgi:N-acyl-D-aspartate/D-glutamate deacylase